MMTFFAAAGSYQIREENGKKMPYIMRLGKLQPVSIPEFYIWSMLLWEVMTIDELKKKYLDQIEHCDFDMTTLERSLEMLVKRKLVVKGVGYTGADALYSMLSDVFVLPVRGIHGPQRFVNVMKLWHRGKVAFGEALAMLQPERTTHNQRRVLRLVTQTPLSVAELVRCFENDVHDVSSEDKVISAIYTDESDNQARIKNASDSSNYRNEVLEAATNLYLTRQVILEHI